MVAYGNTKDTDGEFSCQHGEQECKSDALELCTQYLLSGNINSIETGDTSKAAYPFILCMEEAAGDPTQAESCFNDNMANSHITFDEVNKCSIDDFNTVQTAGMKATAPTNHTYVPWVLVDNELLDKTNYYTLLKSICEAYDGPTPKSCKHLSEEGPDRCYKSW